MKSSRSLPSVLGLLLALLVPAGRQALAAQVLAGPVINPANGHSYYLLETNFWTTAEAEAVELGGHLVTINDAAENDWLLTTFGSYGDVPRQLHLGLTDEGHEGRWTWTSGEPVTYLNWAPGEPNNGAGIFPHENFAFMYAPTDAWPLGSWNDFLGSIPDQRYWGVVEVPPLLSIRISQVELCWPTLTNFTYQVEYTTNLANPAWTPLGAPYPGTGASVCTTDAIAYGQAGRFYRIVTLP